ncbi:pyridoxamine 5'-phosphate oxidase family protein [Nocardioides sp. Root140]|uniref:pyridoxamine 5'-phosphate oxidase family protein n=1 Tax=Nocardioides sp. Root140 TaxID=1736460 RepID=UPI001F171639|nr:pyridoxamine 5'-phosphate oxidase family protein [Nocardioides sp. Root140]
MPRELPTEKCLDLLSAGVVGRVAICTPDGPRIVPVNYAVVRGAVVFRTDPDSVLGQRRWPELLAFEVDHLDYERHRGWSVVAVGPGECVEDPDTLAVIRREWEPRPWAGGERPLHIQLAWTELSGRQLGGPWSSTEEMPVRRTVRRV